MTGWAERRKEKKDARKNEEFIRTYLNRCVEPEVLSQKTEGRRTHAVLSGIRPENDRKQEMLRYLRSERRKLKIRPRKIFRERLWDQVSWLSPGAWIGQSVVLLCFFLILKGGDWEQRETLLMAAGCTPLFGVAGLIELLRSFRNGMWELEECCRYHLRQIQAMRLLIFGIADSMAVLLIFCMGMLEGYDVKLLLLFFLFPLLVSDSVLLLLAGRFRRGAGSVISVAAGFCLGIFWMYQAAWLQDVPGVLEKYTAPSTLPLLLFCGFAFLAFACRRFISETDREEQKSWNYG